MFRGDEMNIQRPRLGRIKQLHQASEENGPCMFCGKPMKEWKLGEECHAKLRQSCVPMLIHPEMKSAFRQFSRNGRWGTCGDCPCDSNDEPYPEFCSHTKRSDHNLNVDQLVDAHKGSLK
jgi:hypothetical protein